MSAPPDVTVVIPTRNRLALLCEAVASVGAQTHPHIELVVVDDGSTDGTWDWLTAQSDDMTVVMRQTEHGERSAARNRGLAAASGRFVLFLDDDDRLTPEALARLVGSLREHPDSLAAIGAMVEFDAAGNRRRERHPRRVVRRAAWPDALFGWKANPGRVLYRVELIREIGGFAEGLRIGEDLELWLRVSRLGPVMFLPYVVLEARIHPGQTTITDGRDSFAQITSKHIDGLQDADRAAAQRVETLRRSYEAALDALDEHRSSAALTNLIGLVREYPRLVLSPIIRPRVVRALSKAVIGLVTGTSGLRSARRVAAKARRVTRTDAWRGRDGDHPR
jgi:hypothetical protein